VIGLVVFGEDFEELQYILWRRKYRLEDRLYHLLCYLDTMQEEAIVGAMINDIIE